jgi:DNA helicase-2/ATP-dependent DNA helicase PcrA
MPLNPSQETAVNTCEGFQLILAGPGSGKTRVITEKILHLLDKGIPANQILALTFSDKAASEMSNRIEAQRPHLDLAIHTFHSFCLDILKENVLASGMSVSGGIISRTTQLVWGLRNIDAFGFEHIQVGNNSAEIVRAVIDGISAFRDELITPAALAEYLERKKGAEVPDGEREYLGLLEDLLKVYRAYEQYKRDGTLIDFDDMIHGAVELLKTNATVRAAYRNRFRYILVDEFQDTNFAQLELIKSLAGDHLCVVGDDDQTIYRFRGAYLTNIRDFREWAQKHAEVLLDRNYRNPPAVLALALRLMAAAPDRQQKDLRTEKPEGEPVTVAACGNEEGEAEYVAAAIGRLAGTTSLPHGEAAERTLEYRDFAVLCRSKKDGAKFQAALRRHGIPSEYQADVDFLRLPVIRDMVAYLQVADNPLVTGVALNRIMKVCSVPETVVQKINAAAGKRARPGSGRSDPEPGNDFVYEVMQDPGDVVPEHAEKIAGIVRMLRHFIEEKERHSLPEIVYEVMMQASGLYRSALNEDAAQVRLYLAKFYEITQEYDRTTPHATIGDFLEYLRFFSAFSVDIEEREEQNAVQVLTVHKSKGKEFPVVFVVDLATNRFPLRYREKTFVVPADLARGLRAGTDEKALFLQEERRLLYVAMTRAEERLYLTYAKWYGDNKRETKPSPFLEEILFRNNPLITLTGPEARGAELPVMDTTPAGELRTSLQKQAIRAIAEMRLVSALQDLVTLERLREYEEKGTEAFDRDGFIGCVDTAVPVYELIATPEPRPILPEKFRFSYSGLKKYQDCPLQFKLAYLLKIPEPPGAAPAASLGSSIHKVIEHLDPARPLREQVPGLLDAFWTPEEYESQTQSGQKKVTAADLVETYIAWLEADRNELVDREKEFAFAFAGKTLHGFIDRIEKTPTGGYVVIDFKSGSKPGDITKKSLPENIQLNVYAMAIRELYGILPERATLFFLKDNKLVDYQPTEDSIGAFTRSLEQMIARIEAGEFPARPDYRHCGWCPYGDLCESREDEGGGE